MACYLDSGIKSNCFGCEACVQACPKHAIVMKSDEDAFRYPVLDLNKCINCNLCRKACPATKLPETNAPVYTFGGYTKDDTIRDGSTSGGAFSAIAEAWADDETLIFGAESVGMEVRHVYVRGSSELYRLRKSKYVQSHIGNAYWDVKNALAEGRRVIFSGTPCQVAGLKTYLGETNSKTLLLIEVICEGVPTPNYINKFAEWLGTRKGGKVQSIDYRFKDGHKWDFEVMQASLQNPTRGIFKWKQDRWFNPFWSIWLQHLMSRPSCYGCPFAKKERVADITLGDLWGVHLYCPELYGRNGGASVVFCNTLKGVAALEKAMPSLVGHKLKTEDAIRYQGPLRGHIKDNPAKEVCLKDVRELPYEEIVTKWAKPPTFKLLWQKYVWGNRQKVWFWNLVNWRFGK